MTLWTRKDWRRLPTRKDWADFEEMAIEGAVASLAGALAILSVGLLVGSLLTWPGL